MYLGTKKDPGIPNLWPFKEELLKRVEEQKRQETLQREKSRNKQGPQPSKLSTNDDKQRLVNMRKEAERKDQQFEASSVNRASSGTLWKGGQFYR